MRICSAGRREVRAQRVGGRLVCRRRPAAPCPGPGRRAAQPPGRRAFRPRGCPVAALLPARLAPAQPAHCQLGPDSSAHRLIQQRKHARLAQRIPSQGRHNLPPAASASAAGGRGQRQAHTPSRRSWAAGPAQPIVGVWRMRSAGPGAAAAYGPHLSSTGRSAKCSASCRPAGGGGRHSALCRCARLAPGRPLAPAVQQAARQPAAAPHANSKVTCVRRPHLSVVSSHLGLQVPRDVAVLRGGGGVE